MKPDDSVWNEADGEWELSLLAPYVHGKLHGKQITTRPSAGDSPEMREPAFALAVDRAAAKLTRSA